MKTLFFLAALLLAPLIPARAATPTTAMFDPKYFTIDQTLPVTNQVRINVGRNTRISNSTTDATTWYIDFSTNVVINETLWTFTNSVVNFTNTTWIINGQTGTVAIINPTDNVIPVRLDAYHFGDSKIHTDPGDVGTDYWTVRSDKVLPSGDATMHLGFLGNRLASVWANTVIWGGAGDFGLDTFDTAAGTLPEGAVFGSPGSLYRYKTGGSGVTLWVKESGLSTTTGWKAVQTASSFNTDTFIPYNNAGAWGDSLKWVTDGSSFKRLTFYSPASLPSQSIDWTDSVGTSRISGGVTALILTPSIVASAVYGYGDVTFLQGPQISVRRQASNPVNAAYETNYVGIRLDDTQGKLVNATNLTATTGMVDWSTKGYNSAIGAGVSHEVEFVSSAQITDLNTQPWGYWSLVVISNHVGGTPLFRIANNATWPNDPSYFFNGVGQWALPGGATGTTNTFNEIIVNNNITVKGNASLTLVTIGSATITNSTSRIMTTTWAAANSATNFVVDVSLPVLQWNMTTNLNIIHATNGVNDFTASQQKECQVKVINNSGTNFPISFPSNWKKFGSVATNTFTLTNGDWVIMAVQFAGVSTSQTNIDVAAAYKNY